MSLPPADGAPPGGEPALRLRLYVCGSAPNSVLALRNLRALREAHLPPSTEVELVDVAVDPVRALHDRVHVTPTLLLADLPAVRVLGNLSDTARVLATLLPHAHHPSAG